MALAHSYSSIKDFEGCARRYHEVRILKKFKSTDTEATLYGTAVHKAFEEHIRDKKPLPESLRRVRFLTQAYGCGEYRTIWPSTMKKESPES